MILEIDAVTPADRRLTVELPPEFPAGQPVSIIVNGRPPKKKYEIDPSFAPDLEAFNRLFPELLHNHPESYVAFKDGKVIAIAPTEREILQKCSNLGLGSVFVRHITLTPIIERLPSIRERR